MTSDNKNPLNVWFRNTGTSHPDSIKKVVTHFMLNGGKLNLSEHHDEFQIMYSKYINYKNCIVERKTDFFKFFIDLMYYQRK